LMISEVFQMMSGHHPDDFPESFECFVSKS
jgi:hypothetical protein